MRPQDPSRKFVARKALRLGVLAAMLGALMTAYISRGGRAQSSPNSEPTATSRQVSLGELSVDRLYAVTISVKDPTQVQAGNSIHIAVADAQGTVIEKSLHVADLDFYFTLRPRASGKAVVFETSSGPIPELTTSIRPVPMEPASAHSAPGKFEPAVIAAQPNSTWQKAQPFEFGQTIYGSADERPYAPALEQDGYAAMLQGFQWFRFTFTRREPRLAYFILNVTDRDVPLDVDIFQPGDYNGTPDVVPYNDGEFIYQIEATQNYPGLYKFRTRILKPGGTYYVRVQANHPAYQLRTLDYPVPPYRDPKQAVRTGMDFLVNMGDTWLSNTPRRGSVALRTSMAYSETHLCIACHPTQFTTRGYLAAVQNGYPPSARLWNF